MAADLPSVPALTGPPESAGAGLVGIGVDLVHVPGFAAQLRLPGSRILEVFTPGERRDVLAGREEQRPRRWAARWAAKEAVVKAWSSAQFGSPPAMGEGEAQRIEALRQIEVARDAWGRPRIVAHGDVARHLSGFRAQVSLSHDGDYAVAYAALVHEVSRDDGATCPPR